MRALAAAAMVLSAALRCAAGATPDAGTARLAGEVREQGWIVFGAHTSQGDWDLFVMRPDGSSLRNITDTRDFNEGLPRFSPGGRQLLYRRISRTEKFDNNRHGQQGQLMLAAADGTQGRPLGKDGEYPWASWSPDGKSIACLERGGIRLVDLSSGRTQRTLQRKGLYQQLTWSPDGKWLCGVANSFDTGWTVARMEVETGQINAVSRVDCCTPDWFGDSKRLVFSGRPGQWTQLWMANGDGSGRKLLYAEDGRHVYGGCASPDGMYILFTGNKEEDGDPKNAGAPMGIMRLADAPILGGDGAELRKQYPEAKAGPVLLLPRGWEPHWTAGEGK
jgi:Tol biopolymer transport system component